MARVTEIFRPEDHPQAGDPATRADLAALWAHLLPGEEQGALHAGYAILAHSPRLALAVAQMADTVIGDIGWTRRRDLRELAIQALNLHLRCDFSFHAHLPIAEGAGITLEQQAAVPYWRTSPLFDDEQRLVIEYTMACAAGPVDEPLFERVKTRFGEAGAVEFTVTIGWWVLWAILLNATSPVFRAERAQPLPKDSSELGEPPADH